MISADQHGSTLQGIASLISAVAWPVLVAVLIFCYRKTLGSVIPIFVRKFESAGTVEVAGLKLTQAEVKQEIEKAVQGSASEPSDSRVPESQIERAKALDTALSSAGVSPSETISVVEGQVLQLSAEYQSIRSSMPSGPERTYEMDQIMARMRTLGLRLLPLLDRMALSRNEGERLAAIASLQVEPNAKYLRWLTERLFVEVPFVFFHASLALSEFVQKRGLSDQLRSELQGALKHILDYPVPDENTVRVLERTLQSK